MLAAVAHLAHAVPAHLRHLVAAAVGLGAAGQVELEHLARDQAQAGDVALGAVVQQHLHAHADAEQRLGGRGLQHRFEQARFAQLAHAVGHGALAGQHHAGGGAHHLGIGGDGDMPPAALGRSLHGLGDGAQIAHAVVHDSHGFYYIIHSCLRLIDKR